VIADDLEGTDIGLLAIERKRRRCPSDADVIFLTSDPCRGW
jgi:hypothetical protein